MREDLFGNLAHPGDVVFTQRGTLGQVALIPDDASTDTYVISQSQMKLTVDREKADPRFIYYYFSSREAQQRILNQNSSSGVPHINLTALRNFPVPNLSVAAQGRIADTLSTYDELIENNQRRIALLEEAARLLYREWFVHFRFPGHEHVKITDGLPEGWERFALSDLADFINGYAFKPAHLGDTGLPIVKIPELKQGVTEKTPRNDGEMIPEKYRLRDGDLLFSWSGTLAVNVWASGPALLNQHLFHVVPRGRVSRGFLMCAIREALIAFENQTVGATMKHIRRSALDRVFIPLPDEAFMSPVEDTLTNTYNQLVVLHQQNQKLAQARDLLLPRLMNGEIAV
ncbi:MAG: restriction endonuclease subunit S [Methylohalobius sp. ZOD2]